MEHGNAPAAGQQSEREAFEAWARDFGFPLERHATAPLTNYADRNATFAWVGWQARATLPAAAACAEQGEAVAWRAKLDGAEHWTYYEADPTFCLHPGEVAEPLYAFLPPPARNGEMSDERIDALLSDLDSIGRDFDMYEYGLPMHGADEEDGPINKLREAVRKWSASCAPKQTEVDGNG